MTNLCVVAAQEARRRLMDEPLRSGTPQLRQAQRILGLSRAQLRRQLRVAGWRIFISRRWFLLPLPVPIKSGVRQLALSLRLRQPYMRLLELWSMLAGKLGDSYARDRNLP